MKKMNIANDNRKNSVKTVWWMKILAILLMYHLSLVPSFAQIVKKAALTTGGFPNFTRSERLKISALKKKIQISAPSPTAANGTTAKTNFAESA